MDIASAFKLKQSLAVNFKIAHTALCDAFLDLLPLVVIMASITLLGVIINLVTPDQHWLWLQQLIIMHGFLEKIFPILVCMTIASYYATAYSVRVTHAIVGSLVTFAFVQVFIYQGFSVALTTWDSLYNINIILSPLAVIICLRFILTPFGLDERTVSLDSNTLIVVRSILPMLLGVGLASLLLASLNLLSIPVIDALTGLVDSVSDTTKNMSRTLALHLMWLTGLHGSNSFDLIFNTEFMSNTYLAGLSHEQFFNLFVVYGGSGSCLSLIIALILLQKDKHTKNLTRIALPMVIFNINEVLIFGLPIMFNRILCIPFVLVPLVNFSLASVILQHSQVMINPDGLHWATPALLNVYWASHGNWNLVWLQIGLIVLGVGLYWPFVKRFLKITDVPRSVMSVHQQFNIAGLLNNAEHKGFETKQDDYWNYRMQLFEDIRTIEKNKLELLYQPVICVNSGRCVSLEALLRIRTKNGELLPPTFMSSFEQSGLAPAIDWWVTQDVKSTLLMHQGPTPDISININPQTLAFSSAVKHIAKTFTGLPVRLEIIERAFLDVEKYQDNISHLLDSGIHISIDDFGVGFSNLSQLAMGVADLVKIDRSLILQLHTQQGQTLFSQVCTMCKNLDLTIVAEGVETQIQYNYAVQAGVNMVQGFFFSEALPWDQALAFYQAREPTA
jgi:EAL domain-containing protein (putative c-di-GMP-specific phosphodiesterase class I)/cellobiose-specific phosphotransferase system component IIC|tara:strand:- start:2328 stop:4349 length:2022 start_codon:yes stop_codon:yes gene_type:complete